jgi:hypothetical protein
MGEQFTKLANTTDSPSHMKHCFKVLNFLNKFGLHGVRILAVWKLLYSFGQYFCAVPYMCLFIRRRWAVVPVLLFLKRFIILHTLTHIIKLVLNGRPLPRFKTEPLVLDWELEVSSPTVRYMIVCGK